jgi:hypothetical protein
MDAPGRSENTLREKDPQKFGLPPRIILYTLDQIATFIEVPITEVRRRFIHFDGRTLGVPKRKQMVARNIAPDNEKAEWRVAEQELLRWAKACGYKFYSTGSLGF